MATKTRELWQHSKSGEWYIVDRYHDGHTAATGPVYQGDAADMLLGMAAPKANEHDLNEDEYRVIATVSRRTWQGDNEVWVESTATETLLDIIAKAQADGTISEVRIG